MYILVYHSPLRLSLWDVRPTISDLWVNLTFASFAHNVSYEGGTSVISRMPSLPPICCNDQFISSC